MQRLFIFFSTVCLFACASPSRIHSKAVVIDTHNDVLSTASMRGMALDSDLSGKTHSDVNRMIKGGVDIQVFSIFCDERFGKDTAFRYANIEIDSLQTIIQRNPQTMMLVTSPKELRSAVRQKKLGCMIGVEGGHMIEDSLENLEKLYMRGARYLTLTWNNSTLWASSAWDEKKYAETATKQMEAAQLPFERPPVRRFGLNEFGRSVVRKMNELGMMIDVSHVGPLTFRDVIQETSKPVIASHSCAAALCAVPRNLDDEQLRAIAKNGGVVHLNFYSGFIDSNYNNRKNALVSRHQKEADSLKTKGKANWEIEEWIFEKYPEESNAIRPPLSLLIDHVDHIVKIAGIDHVGIGSDFDGIESAPQQLDDVASLPNLTKALLKRGYSKTEVRKILGKNFIRVFTINSNH